MGGPQEFETPLGQHPVEGKDFAVQRLLMPSKNLNLLPLATDSGYLMHLLPISSYHDTPVQISIPLGQS